MSHPFSAGPANPELCATCTWPEDDVAAHGEVTMAETSPPLERQRFYASHLGADRLGPFVTERAALEAVESERTNGSPHLEGSRVWSEWGCGRLTPTD